MMYGSMGLCISMMMISILLSFKGIFPSRLISILYLAPYPSTIPHVLYHNPITPHPYTRFISTTNPIYTITAKFSAHLHTDPMSRNPPGSPHRKSSSSILLSLHANLRRLGKLHSLGLRPGDPAAARTRKRPGSLGVGELVVEFLRGDDYAYVN